MRSRYLEYSDTAAGQVQHQGLCHAVGQEVHGSRRSTCLASPRDELLRVSLGRSGQVGVCIRTVGQNCSLISLSTSFYSCAF